MSNRNRVLKRPREFHEVMSARASIRNFCLQCMGWETASHEVERCTAPDCRLYPWRLGTTPDELRRRLSEKAKAARRKSLAKAHEAIRRKVSAPNVGKCALDDSEVLSIDAQRPQKAAG